MAIGKNSWITLYRSTWLAIGFITMFWMFNFSEQLDVFEDENEKMITQICPFVTTLCLPHSEFTCLPTYDKAMYIPCQQYNIDQTPMDGFADAKVGDCLVDDGQLPTFGFRKSPRPWACNVDWVDRCDWSSPLHLSRNHGGQ
ncbi:hypothetical protein F4805DRAFT_356863 [Annulohypoxylon moriforme]|nr:hypothetical protein F4805DRAFT_356863 [Annulohypoxylon moriforme]